MAQLLYDAECGFCQTWVQRGRRLLRADVHARPLQEFSSTDSRLSPAELRHEIKLVMTDGQFFSGAEAVARAVGGVAMLYYLPGLGWLADRTYSWVARRRHTLPGGCDSTGCSIEGSRTRN